MFCETDDRRGISVSVTRCFSRGQYDIRISRVVMIRDQ